MAGTAASVQYIASHVTLLTDAELWQFFVALEAASYAVIAERGRRRGMIPE